MNDRKAALSTITAVLTVALSPGCGSGPSEDGLGNVRELADPPAGPGAAQPHLSTSDEGRAYLSWLEPTAGGEEHALRFSALEGESWSSPGTVAVGDDFFVNWADFPSVVPLPDGTLAAHWLVKSGPETYAYEIHLARSGDGGRTWSEAVVPHRDGTPTEHGFVSLYPRGESELGLIWLDGRDFVEDGAPEMSLRYASFGPDGARGEAALIDGRVCDCCQTSVALTASGPVAVYRDRSDEEIRDISIVRHDGEGWGEPRAVHRDGWRIPACPVNGPAVAARDRRVVVAWFTAADDRPRVRLAFSDDAGESFGEPVRIDTGAPTGRVDVELLPDGSALVSWIETVEGAARLLVRRAPRDGAPLPPRRVAATSEGRPAGFPQMELAGNRVIFAWTDPGDPSRVRAGVLPLTSITHR